MIKKLNAFFLTANPYKDTSLIAKFLTDSSMLEALCYSVKKNTKNIGSDLNSISKLEITVYESKNSKLSSVKETSIIKNYKHIEKSPLAEAFVFYIKEILINVASYYDPKYFMLTEKIYEALEENEIINKENSKNYIEILTRSFELKTLYIMGVMPNISDCVLCKNNKSSKWFFSESEGGLICENCKKENLLSDTLQADKNTIYFLNFIKNNSLINIVKNNDIINYKNEAKNISKTILQKTLFSHIGVKIKSLKFFEEIINHYQ